MIEAGHTYISEYIKNILSNSESQIDYGIIIGQFKNQKYFALHVIPCSIVLEEDGLIFEGKLKELLRNIRNILPGGLDIIGFLATDKIIKNLPMKIASIMDLFTKFFKSYSSIHPMYFPMLIRYNPDTKYLIYDNDGNDFEITDSPLDPEFKLIYFTSKFDADIHIPLVSMESSVAIYDRIIASLASYFQSIHSSKLVFKENFIPNNFTWTEDMFKEDNFSLLIEAETSETGSMVSFDINQTVSIKGSILCRPCISTSVLSTEYIENAIKEDLFRSIYSRVFLISMESNISGMTQLSDWSLLSPLRVEISVDENPLALKFTDYVLSEESVQDIQDRIYSISSCNIKSDMIEYLEKSPENEDLIGLISSSSTDSDKSSQEIVTGHEKVRLLTNYISFKYLIILSVIVLLLALMFYKYGN